ncbi:MAG: hypothetical protein Q8K78_18480 [Planctomycetaceae bacterium]|nr:hypothetical protein [Planctomycetaceae bacterium]
MTFTQKSKFGVKNLRRHPWLITIACATAAWMIAYHVTESRNPLLQFFRVFARYSGPMYLRTERESTANMAIFHLRKAMPSYFKRSDDKGWTFPKNWSELIAATGEYRGPHLNGRLVSAYPILQEPLDPWGHPWVYRVVEDELSDAEIACVRITIGSLGPNGVECPESNDDDYNTRRRTCDDIFEHYLNTNTPRGKLLPNTSKVTTPIKKNMRRAAGKGSHEADSDPSFRLQPAHPAQ